MAQRKYKKQYIPKVLKNMVWDTHIGREKGIGNCYCCNKELDSKHFECGHIVAESCGGELNVDNLRPVCSLCNKSIGKKHMDEFKKKYINNNMGYTEFQDNVFVHNICLHSFKKRIT
jgi:hypothetical protein